MVKIEITGDTPLETLASLTAFGMHCLQNKDVYAAANRILEAEQHETRKAASGLTTSPVPAPASDPTPGPAVTPGPAAPKSGPKAPPAEVPTPPAVSVDDAPAPTVAEVESGDRSIPQVRQGSHRGDPPEVQRVRDVRHRGKGPGGLPGRARQARRRESG
ncbi:MAG: hypothetical protein ACLU9S_20175 [Oscillospiraceae bacterium]